MAGMRANAGRGNDERVGSSDGRALAVARRSPEAETQAADLNLGRREKQAEEGRLHGRGRIREEWSKTLVAQTELVREGEQLGRRFRQNVVYMQPAHRIGSREWHLRWRRRPGARRMRL
eukprot:2931265-Pleurochrysis_carterae.AAC.2